MFGCPISTHFKSTLENINYETKGILGVFFIVPSFLVLRQQLKPSGKQLS
jgi:hypothetical protein